MRIVAAFVSILFAVGVGFLWWAMTPAEPESAAFAAAKPFALADRL